MGGREFPGHFFPIYYACKEIAEKAFCCAKEEEGSNKSAMICSWPDVYLALETQYEFDEEDNRDVPSLGWSHKYHGAAAFHAIGQTSEGQMKSSDWIRVLQSKVILPTSAPCYQERLLIMCADVCGRSHQAHPQYKSRSLELSPTHACQ